MRKSASASLSSPAPSAFKTRSQSNKPKTKRPRRNFNTEKRLFATIPGRRSSIYRGVTRHRWTGRYEAHLWDKSSWNPIQNKKGRQVYLGAYDDEEAAAHTYDLAALKYWGTETILNFPFHTYSKEYDEMQSLSKEEYLATLRRRSSGFSRGVSKYRGVARHHHNGRWEARIGRVLGNKYVYLGTYGTQEEAAQAYDLAAIEYRGLNAVTNFDISHYMNYQNLQPLLLQLQQQQPLLVPPPLHLPENPEPAAPAVDDGSIMGVDPLGGQPWDLSMDPSAFDHLMVPDFPLDCKANDLHNFFGDLGFVDNIDLFFEGSEVTGNSSGSGGSQEEDEEDDDEVNVDGILVDCEDFVGSEFLAGEGEQGEEGEKSKEEMGSTPISYPITIYS